MNLAAVIRDSLRLAAVYYSNTWVVSTLTKAGVDLPWFWLEIITVVLTLFVVTLVTDALFGLPRINVIWSDPSQVEITGTAITLFKSSHEGAGIHPLKVRYECHSWTARRIDGYLRRKKVYLSIQFNPSAVHLTPEGDLTRSRELSSDGIVELVLHNAVLNGDRSWCELGLEPKKGAPIGLGGDIEYALRGEGRFMVVAGFFIRPKSTVRELRIIRGNE